MLYGWSHLSSTGIVVDRVQLKFFEITFVIVVPNTTFWSFSKLLSLSALSEWIVAVAASEKKCDSSLSLLSLRGNFVSFPRGLPITAAHLLFPRVALPVNWIFIFFPSCKSWQFANLIYLIRASIAIFSFCLMEVWRAIILSVVALGGASLSTGLISWTEEKKRVTNLLPCPGLAFLLTIMMMLATRTSVGSLVKGGSFS